MKKLKVLFLYSNMQMMFIIPAAITSLSAYLKKHNIDTDLFETTLYKIDDKSSDDRRAEVCQVKPTKPSDVGLNYRTTNMVDDFQEKINIYNPDVIAISCNDFTHITAENLLDQVIIPNNVRVIMGGIYPTFFPEYAVKHKKINAICIGEGFDALVDYVQNPQRTDILNLWIKENNIIHKNLLRKPINLSKLPIEDFSIFDEKRLYRPMHGKMLKMLPFWIDIGCPYSCAYCTAPSLRNLYENNNYHYLRVKDVKQIIDELQFNVKKYNVEYLYCSTENFFSRPKHHILDFAKQYIEKIKLPFWAETRVENLTDENVQILKDMGCSRLSLGLESGCEEYRTKHLHKKFTNEQFRMAIKNLSRYNLNCTINNMINFPDETRDMIFKTIYENRKVVEDYKNIDISLTVSVFVPCGGSNLQQECIQRGYLNLDEYLQKPPNTFHGGFWLKNKNLTESELKGLYRTFPLYVRLPASKFNDIKKAEIDDNLYTGLKEIYWKLNS